MVASNLQRSRLHSVLSFVNGTSMAVGTAEHPPGPGCALQHKDPGLCPVACVTAAQLFGHMSAKGLESNSLNPGSTCIWPCWHNCWAQWWLICFSPTYISSCPSYELWIQKCGIIRDVLPELMSLELLPQDKSCAILGSERKVLWTAGLSFPILKHFSQH